MENPIAPTGNAIERTLHGVSTNESACPGPIIRMFALPSLAGAPMGIQFSAVLHLLSSELPPSQVSPARADATTPLLRMSRQNLPAHFLRSLPAAIYPPPQGGSIGNPTAISSKLHL